MDNKLYTEGIEFTKSYALVGNLGLEKVGGFSSLNLALDLPLEFKRRQERKENAFMLLLLYQKSL